MRLVLVRHGATDWSVTGQHTGVTDLPLTDLGLAQADSAAQAVRVIAGADLSSAVVYSSPMSRALVTAHRVVGGSYRVNVTDDLREYDYGDYEGRTPSEIRERRPGWDIWTDGCPGGEQPEDVGERADHFLAMVAAVPTLCIAFAHGHIIRIIAARAVGLPANRGQIFTLDTATVSLIADVRGKRVIKLWNLDPQWVVGSQP
jgi:broad specificity phosphatase PhoE